MRRVGRGLFRSIFETTISCLETKRTGLSSGLGRSVHLSETRTSKVIQLRQGLDPTSDLTHHSRRKGVILIYTLAILNYLGARARAAPQVYAYAHTRAMHKQITSINTHT